MLKHPQTTPRHIPRHPKIHEKVTPTRPENAPKVTCASWESNPPPPASKSQDHPTGLFSPQNIASLRVFYASKIKDVCSRARRVLPQPELHPQGFFCSQTSNFVKAACASWESNRVPPDSKSEGLPTKLFSPQSIASLRIRYASKIRGVCPRTRRGFFKFVKVPSPARLTPQAKKTKKNFFSWI